VFLGGIFLIAGELLFRLFVSDFLNYAESGNIQIVGQHGNRHLERENHLWKRNLKTQSVMEFQCGALNTAKSKSIQSHLNSHALQISTTLIYF
jgi:hypothetical protein